MQNNAYKNNKSSVPIRLNPGDIRDARLFSTDGLLEITFSNFKHFCDLSHFDCLAWELQIVSLFSNNGPVMIYRPGNYCLKNFVSEKIVF